MTVHRNLLLVLAAVAAMNSFVSCAKSDGAEENTSGDLAITTAAVTEPPVFKNRDYEGEEFTFLTYNKLATEYVDTYIWSDAVDGSSVEKAVIERNQETEKKYNVSITADQVISPQIEVINRTQAGQVDFDVIYEWGTRTSSLALDGVLYNFRDLDSVDLSRSYWIPSARDDLTIGGKMYIATNYITMNSIGWANFILYNKTMYEELELGGSLYDAVKNGEWVFDKYVDLAVSVSKDLDGDGIMTSNDRFGLWGSVSECLTDMAQSAGITNTTKEPDGIYNLSMYNEVAVDIYTAFRHKLDSANTFISYEMLWSEKPDLSEYGSRYKGARYLGFGEGHVLFMQGTMDIAYEFVGMEDDYGILPNPLKSAEQTDYYHFVDTNAPMFSIPAEGQDPEKTGVILEYMAYKSEEYLLPAFCEAIIEEGSEDSQMFCIIKNSIKYEWTDIYGLDVTNSILPKMMTSGSFKTVYNRLASKAKAEIEGCVTSLTFMGLS